ncbi:COG1361 S-layer family protein [Halorarum salinum]|uniref:Sialidase n=1 Tax=Halorarum salinum TaxID=2743089 RepID=A0A7D5Q9I8_9EURY|nr:COG1361 S-layer family protein [Halobaculum salinum]QLG61697.1 sialidase [Halobaculum salinum]
MVRRSLLLCVVVLLVAVPTAVTAVDARFETSVPEPTVEPGSTQELTFELANDAADPDDRAETAHEVEATVRGDDTPMTVRSGPRSLGTMSDGDGRSVTVSVTVPADVPAGTYDLPVTVEYLDAGDDRETETTTVRVRVDERARFVVEDVDADVPVGGSGTVALNVTNAGEANASGAVMAFESGNADVTFAGSATTRRFVGEWAAGETRTVEVDASAADGADPREYAVDATVEYEDADGLARTSAPLSFGLTPLPEATFVFGELESTLRVGGDGTLSGTVENAGDRTVHNAVLLLETDDPNVSPLESELAVGTLDPGESAAFEFDVEVSDSAEAGARQFGLVVEYRDVGGSRITSDETDVLADVAAPRDEFDVAPLDAEFEAGSGGQLRLEVTNNREAPVSDVSAKLFPDAPLSSGDDEAFHPNLDPGETVTLTFDLRVDDAALEKSYPLSVDFRYETADGDTRLSDAYQVPVTVSGGNGGDLPLSVLGGTATLFALLVGGVYYVRR